MCKRRHDTLKGVFRLEGILKCAIEVHLGCKTNVPSARVTPSVMAGNVWAAVALGMVLATLIP